MVVGGEVVVVGDATTFSSSRPVMSATPATTTRAATRATISRRRTTERVGRVRRGRMAGPLVVERGQAHASRSCLASLGGPLGPRLASLGSGQGVGERIRERIGCRRA